MKHRNQATSQGLDTPVITDSDIDASDERGEKVLAIEEIIDADDEILDYDLDEDD